LAKVTAQEFRPYSSDDPAAWNDAVLTFLLVKYEGLLLGEQDNWLLDEMQNLFADPMVQQYLQVNSYNNVLWFSKERFEKLVSAISEITGMRGLKGKKGEHSIQATRGRAAQLVTAAETAGYQVGTLLGLFRNDGAGLGDNSGALPGTKG